MTLLTVTSPYDPLTLTEIRNEIAVEIGLPYASWDPTLQTSINRVIDSSAEFVVKTMGYPEWAIHEESISLAANVAVLSLSAVARHVVTIQEVYDGVTRTVNPTTKKDYLERYGSAGGTSDPWNDQAAPKWFQDGRTGDAPPQIQLKRAPTPAKALTGTALVRPLLTIRSTVADDTEYGHMPAEAQEMMMSYIKRKVALIRKDYEAAGAWGGDMALEQRALEIAETTEGWEAPSTIDYPNFVDREMTL